MELPFVASCICRQHCDKGSGLESHGFPRGARKALGGKVASSFPVPTLDRFA